MIDIDTDNEDSHSSGAIQVIELKKKKNSGKKD